MSARRYMKYPVSQNGVYINPTTGSLEFWFVFKGRKALVGECRSDLSQMRKDFWEKECVRQIQELLAKTFAARPIPQLGHRRD